MHGRGARDGKDHLNHLIKDGYLCSMAGERNVVFTAMTSLRRRVEKEHAGTLGDDREIGWRHVPSELGKDVTS